MTILLKDHHTTVDDTHGYQKRAPKFAAHIIYTPQPTDYINNDPNHPTAMMEEAVEWMWW
jgi:hypothetical protein